MRKDTYVDLLLEMSLRHLYSAEKIMKDNLKTMSEKASSHQLKEVCNQHVIETQKQIERLEKVFELLDIDPTQTKIQGFGGMLDKGKEMLNTLMDMNFNDRSKGMEGIINEGQDLLRHFADTGAGDLAIIGSARKVEHFEIACYNTICSLLEQYDQKEALDLLKTSLEEEIQADQMLASIKQESVLYDRIPLKASDNSSDFD